MNLKTGWRSLLFGALVAGMSISACQCYPEPFQVVEPPAAVDPVARKVSGLFIDAKSNQLIATPLTVTIRNEVGQLSTIVKNDTTKAKTNQFTLEDGILTFEVDETATLPQTLTIVAFGDGFNSSSAKVTITENGAYDFLARMVKISDPPTGVSAKQETIGNADGTGTLMVATSVSTDPEGTTGGAVELEIPAMTKVTTADGTPLTGTLTATVSYFNNTDTTSLSAFPGGLEVTVPQGAGERASGVFISGGFAAIEIRDSDGNLASKFSQPVAVTVGVPTATVNPDTNVAVQSGEAVPFWSYNETTGQWAGEGNVTLSAGPSGLFNATGMVDHLSYFNIDWFEEPCGTARRVDVTGNPEKLGYTVELKNAGRGFVNNLQVPGGDGSDFVQMFNVPSQMPMILTAFFQGQKVGEVQADDMCAGGPVTLQLTLPNTQPASLNVNVAKVCTDNPEVRTAVPSQTVVVIPVGTNVTPLPPSVTDAAGIASFDGLASGVTVKVSAQTPSGTQMVEKVIAPGQNDVAFDVRVACTVVSGAVSSQP